MARVSYEEFARLQIRIARVVSAESIPGKTRIMRGVVDLGEQTSTVIIGGAQYYTPEEMVGRKVVVLANLEPRTVADPRPCFWPLMWTISHSGWRFQIRSQAAVLYYRYVVGESEYWSSDDVSRCIGGATHTVSVLLWVVQRVGFEPTNP